MFVTNEVLTANEIGGVKKSNKSIRKYGKLSKTRKLSKGLKLSKSRNSKGEKLSKSQKSAKSKKKLSKSRNSLNFDTKKKRAKFFNLQH